MFIIIEKFDVPLFNNVNKALFYTTLKKSCMYFNNHDAVLFFNILIDCAYLFCTIIGRSRIGFFDTNFLKFTQ